MERKFVPVLNSLVFIEDSAARESPEIDGEQSFWRNSTGIAVSCLPDSDGDTEIVLADTEPVPAAALIPLLDETVQIPSGWLVVDILPDIELFRVRAPRSGARLRVWTDGFPDTRIVYLLID